jgi:hypothetical protein
MASVPGGCQQGKGAGQQPRLCTISAKLVPIASVPACAGLPQRVRSGADATSTEWLAAANARGALRRLYIRGQIFPQIDARTGDWCRKFSEQADGEAKAFARLRLGAEGGDADSQT